MVLMIRRPILGARVDPFTTEGALHKEAFFTWCVPTRYNRIGIGRILPPVNGKLHLSTPVFFETEKRQSRESEDLVLKPTFQYADEQRDRTALIS